ncbi:MAG: hydroxyisourate hydrolase [Rubrobacteraceae bacterium]
MPGRLTTHVLDTANGRPAAGIEMELFGIEKERRRHLKTVRANGDGRLDAPLLEGEELSAGEYEIVFHVGAYLGGGTGSPPFLDRVPVRFGVSDPAAHYHVPLLFSPWSYTTYRGS